MGRGRERKEIVRGRKGVQGIRRDMARRVFWNLWDRRRLCWIRKFWVLMVVTCLGCTLKIFLGILNLRTSIFSLADIWMIYRY